jgi:hypothetical protein
MTSVITDTQTGKVQEMMQMTNTKLVDMHRHLEESMANVDILKSLIRFVLSRPPLFLPPLWSWSCSRSPFPSFCNFLSNCSAEECGAPFG